MWGTTRGGENAVVDAMEKTRPDLKNSPTAAESTGSGPDPRKRTRPVPTQPPVFTGVPGAIRTHGLRIRNTMNAAQKSTLKAVPAQEISRRRAETQQKQRDKLLAGQSAQ